MTRMNKCALMILLVGLRNGSIEIQFKTVQLFEQLSEQFKDWRPYLYFLIQALPRMFHGIIYFDRIYANKKY